MYNYRDNEKIKLTPQKISMDLRKRIVRDSMGLVWVWSMLILGGGAILFSVFWALTGKLPLAVRSIAGVVILISAVVVIAYIFHRRVGKYTAWAKAGKFRVVTDTLSSMSLHGYQGYIWAFKPPFLPFNNEFFFGTFEPYYVEQDELSRATEGDKYFIVVFEDEPNRPRQVYRADTYDWRG